MPIHPTLLAMLALVLGALWLFASRALDIPVVELVPLLARPPTE